MMKFFPHLLLILMSLFLFGCSVTSPELNKPIRHAPSVASQQGANRSDELTLILTFSGGGTRAAALSYGVLQELRDTPVRIRGGKRRMLDEVDLISSVSGGSFTSAYYGLFGDQIFQDFERKFLKKRVQTELLRLSLFSPKAWIRLAPALFERSDLAAEYYNRTIFRKKRFKDMRKDAPRIVINATDLSLGRGFAFTDYHFSWICSDLGSYPVGRAVAASSAVPVVFSPIALRNYSGKQGCRFAPRVAPQPQNSSSITRAGEDRLKQSLSITNYLDGDQYRYLHLVDGGVSDNLGIRSLLDMVAFNQNDMWTLLKKYHMEKTRKMAFIVVNASSFFDPGIPKRQVAPSTVKVIDATTTIQSNEYNVETLELLRSQFPDWVRQVKNGRCKEKPAPGCSDIQFSLIEVDLRDLQNQERQRLLYVPTSLELPGPTVDLLKQAGRNLLRRSKGFRRLLKSVN